MQTRSLNTPDSNWQKTVTASTSYNCPLSICVQQLELQFVQLVQVKAMGWEQFVKIVVTVGDTIAGGGDTNAVVTNQDYNDHWQRPQWQSHHTTSTLLTLYKHFLTLTQMKYFLLFSSSNNFTVYRYEKQKFWIV